MKIHEFQAKELLRNYGVAVPDGDVARTPEEAEKIATKLNGRVVIKAQIHAGGRGKGGGVKVVANADEARQAAEQILGMKAFQDAVKKNIKELLSQQEEAEE